MKAGPHGIAAERRQPSAQRMVHPVRILAKEEHLSRWIFPHPSIPFTDPPFPQSNRLP